MSIPSGTKFIGIAPGVDTVEKKSTQANSPSNVYTIEDIQDGSVPDTRTITINGDTKDLSADRSWTISTGITVGTTAVTSGTDTRVFFQAGGVVQQDANFTFDNTLKRLTLKAVGTAATDIPFQVLNSAATATPLYVRGTGNVEMQPTNSGAGTLVKFTYDANGASNVTYGTPSGLVWHNFYTPYVYSALDGNNGYEGRIDLGRYNGTVRTRLACTGDSFFQFSNLVIGATTAGARLDVRAQGALSTDIAFRVRNSADTYNMSDVQGDSIFNFRVNNTATSSVAGLNLLGTNTDVVINARSTNAGGSNVTGFLASGGGGSVGLYTDYGGKLGALYAGVLRFNTASTDRMNFVNASNNCSGWAFLQTSASTYALGNTVFAIYPTNAQAGGGTLALGTTLGTTVSSLPAATYGKNTFFIANGTAPTTTGADAFGLYSADITAGNAAPHFRTENGAIVKVYQETTGVGASTLVSGVGTPLTDTDTFDGYTLKQIVKALRNQGLLA